MQAASSSAMANGETNWEEDRKAAWRCLAAFYRDPTQFGCSSNMELILPYGFNLQTAEFEPDALKCFRDPAKAAKQKSPSTGPGGYPGGPHSSSFQSSPSSPFKPAGNPFAAAKSSPFANPSPSPWPPGSSPFQR